MVGSSGRAELLEFARMSRHGVVVLCACVSGVEIGAYAAIVLVGFRN